ncbi:MAG: 2Fe-2S iron-sulfur cluster-binding protein [Alphaproteobacteria bacterium]|jgi:hypothetical protein|nr:2Fe-2S iron-sulfur cluster-binding protein [Alphaproteobacteria bacterium]MDP6256051.1 2Fe-2S iron-sulfur cluster-binding protein [Alphaproteobacteria bacterium]MDP7054278.1 2Fe-2S iron-sulfur cluster-binding protein [Alphaproteobacteria bacterium]MDP7230576.1 2Fe-2S iron-sulfur cluster-binding protein [Alphaproteobacteria bacterium]MDP7459407.1 2Fe-2S iron-sulfur cluster-binding protein [Alphaproteobacteria bacterium]|tara:strand:- start:16934 stop:18208 length:1275 start_codon:yes stop_codon:yes gene_type:complete
MDVLIDLAAITFLGVVTVCTGSWALMYNRRTLLARKTHEHQQNLLRAQIDLIADRRRMEREKTDLSWNGSRKFEIQRKQIEADGVCSFYLTPHDRKNLPPFEPGQFLTFNLPVPGQTKNIVRCYSLSDSPNHPDYYRVSIKRVPPPRDQPELPPGLSSNYFLDHMEEGDILDVMAPSGHFYLDMSSHNPVVLIGGGVGLTPVLSMLNAIVATGSQRETHFFYGIVSGKDHAFKDHLNQIARENINVHLHVCYSNPAEDDVGGEDYQHAGRVGVPLFKELLDSNNYDFYLCGPPPMMNSIVGDLGEWGVPEKNIHFEAFGPASVKKTKDEQKTDGAAPDVSYEVNFARSNKKITWTPETGSLLELAECNGVNAINSGCRAGNCGSCITAIKQGEVEYVSEPGSPPEDGSCLACITVPKSNMEIDA